MTTEYIPSKLVPLFAGEFVVDATAVEGLDERMCNRGVAARILINAVD